MYLMFCTKLYKWYFRAKPRFLCDFMMCSADLINSFSRGLLKMTTHGRSDRADFGAGRGGDLEGDALPRFFRLVFGVASLFCTRWGKRSRSICSRSSSTICQQNYNREITENITVSTKVHT